MALNYIHASCRMACEFFGINDTLFVKPAEHSIRLSARQIVRSAGQIITRVFSRFKFSELISMLFIEYTPGSSSSS